MPFIELIVGQNLVSNVGGQQKCASELDAVNAPKTRPSIGEITFRTPWHLASFQ